jgi:hypothetical protein
MRLPNFTLNRAAILIFSLYLAIGLIIAKDYGSSIDDETERITSLSNYVYVFGKKMHESKSESVRNVANKAPNLMTYIDRFYGTALQNTTVFIEHLFNFELPSRDVFLLRHTFTFLNYFVAGIFFYLILRRRFGNTFIPLLGALLYILYPRFFGESFFNIKDMVFISWYIISVYFALRWLGDKQNYLALPTAATIAIATNTRILGISVLLLACVFAVVIDMRKKLNFWQAIQKPLVLMALAFVCYVIITPFTWENPIKNTIDTFLHFTDYQRWDKTHLYMGEMITRHVPWHYIPVWMGLTVPLFYIAMFFIGVARKPAHLFDAFFAALFFCTLFGFIGLRISMYEGWRHAYCIYGSFLYIAVLGLERSFAFLQNKRLAFRRGFACVTAACMVYLFAWNVANHPYQSVYFNIVGRQFAEKNFFLNMCDISFTDLMRKVLANDDRPKIKVAVHGEWSKKGMLTDDEKKRVVWSNVKADYYFQDRMSFTNKTHDPAGFVEIDAVFVDGMKTTAMFKRIEPSGNFDDDAWSKITKFESNVNNDFDEMSDEDYDTEWSTNRPQQPGDYIMFEFEEDVSYNYLFLDLSNWVSGDYSRDLHIYVSADGNAWQESSTSVVAQVYYKFEAQPYRFLKLENKGSDDHFSWSISEMKFGYALR